MDTTTISGNQPQTPGEVVDGVHRYPASGLRVLVVGAGVGGLQAALECWRKGHEVQVLERSEALSTLGDYFTITPSGLSTLDKYPSMKAKYNETIHDSLIKYCSPSGKEYFSAEPEWHRGTPHAAGTGKVSFLKRRAEFAQMQLDQATRLGIKVFWGRKVVSFEEKTTENIARVTCESGEAFDADIVVAADGVGSKSHSAVTGHEANVYSSGYAIARTAFSSEHIAPGSLAETMLPKAGERPEFRVYLGEKLHFIVFLNHDAVGFAHTHLDDANKAHESWHNFITPQQLADTLPDTSTWDPALLDLIRQIPADKNVVDWKLSWRDPLPQWTSPGGRIVQLGDAAHAFLPTSGNGATQALEDAISLGECLRLGGRAAAPWSTRVHERLRYERVSLIQKTGFTNRERVHHAWRQLESPDPDVVSATKASLYRQGPWMWAHRAEDYASENYEAALASLKDPKIKFENSNLPPDSKYEPWTVESALEEERRQWQA